jgi:hypothetical protein
MPRIWEYAGARKSVYVDLVVGWCGRAARLDESARAAARDYVWTAKLRSVSTGVWPKPPDDRS